MLISKPSLCVILLFVSVHSVPSISSSPQEQLSQKPDNVPSNEALSFISRFMQNGGIMNMVNKMFIMDDTKSKMDSGDATQHQPESSFSIDSAPSQINDSKQWKSLLLGPRGVLTEIFNQVKDKMQSQYSEDMQKMTNIKQEKQHDMSPEQLNFARVFETFMQKAGKGNFDEPLPELPFIGICNRLNCGDIYKAVDEFRKSDFFSNFQTAMGLIHDPKGWDIIGKVLENPELIEDFTNKNKIDSTDMKPDELSGFGTDFSSSVDGTPEKAQGKEEKLPPISSNLDYYSALEHVKPEDEDVIDIIEPVDAVTPARKSINTPSSPKIFEKKFKEEPLPTISENIDDYEVQITKEETIPVNKEGPTYTDKNLRPETTTPHYQARSTQGIATSKFEPSSLRTPFPPIEPVRLVPRTNFRQNNDYYAMYYDT
ncbi:unnamed protein product [Bursaphelenchus xylophilus]|uniref:(pine wood nematode) hypothetical protein n=1 Tax=Bursaphelenchus xylophilus TaxID=6326 RepID=A0A1I7SDA8_BURXY|nr:unnamed protein product [Bursaphelenchus xylophilus]CAG9130567.1 unnamed protein product [Bursaphelenchus xylophilus]